MSNPQHEFTGVFIPSHIWLSPDLSPAEKMMLGEVDALSRRTGWCTAGRQHFAAWLHCTLPNVTYYTRRLEEMGYLQIVRDAGGASKMRVVGARFYENLDGSKHGLPVNQVYGGSKQGLPEIKYKENNEIELKNNNAQSAFPLSENEEDYIKIEMWSAETKIIELNIERPEEDTPGGGGVLPGRYIDADFEELKRRNPDRKKDGRRADSKTAQQIAKIEEVIQYLNLAAGTNYKANSKAALKYIGGRLSEGASVADMCRVIDRKCTEWLQDARMRQYLTPDTLFNAEKYEKYLNQLTMKAPKATQPTARLTRLQMGEPDFEQHKEKQAF